MARIEELEAKLEFPATCSNRFPVAVIFRFSVLEKNLE